MEKGGINEHHRVASLVSVPSYLKSTLSVKTHFKLTYYGCFYKLLANNVDPDHTTPKGAVCSGSTMFCLHILHEY